MAKPPGHVPDELVQAKNFHADENDRRMLYGRGSRVIDRHVASDDFDLGVTDLQSLGIGVDDIRADRPGGKRVACGGRCRTRHESAPRQGRHDFGKAKMSDGN